MAAAFLGSSSLLVHPPKKPNVAFSSPSSSQQPTPPSPSPSPEQARTGARRTPESTDWVASSLSRRFGIGAGLAWAGFLAVGVVSEQIKTRFEAFRREANTKDVEEEEIVLPNGIRYFDMRIGGGDAPMAGDLVVLDLLGRVLGDGGTFIDTFNGSSRPLALVLGSRPYTKGMCEGVEYVLRSMRAGGKRRVVVPPALGFGDDGADFGTDVKVPPGAALEFIVQVDKVSVAPS